MLNLSRTHLPLLYALLVTLLGLAVTAAYWQAGEQEVHDRADNALHTSSDQIASVINQRMRSCELALRGVKGLWESSDIVTGAEFHRYVEALQLTQTRPGLQAIGFVSHVPTQRLNTFAAQMRASGQPSYQVRPAGTRPRYAPVAYIEPRTDINTAILGVDLATNPIARIAMDRAGDTGELALSDSLRLMQDAPQGLAARPAAALYMPVYTPTMPTDSAEQRQHALMGWVSGPFRYHELIEALNNALDADIHITLLQHTAPGATHLLYLSGDADTPSPTRRTTRTVNIGGNQVTLILTALPAFANRFTPKGHNAIALAGGALSLLLGAMIWLLATRRDHAFSLAHAMTQDLQRSHA